MKVSRVESLEALQIEMRKAEMEHLREQIKNTPTVSRMNGATKKPIDLNNPAMQATLDELENIWAARFGMKWVPKGEIEDSTEAEFWNIVLKRLLKADRLEEFDLVHAYQTVFRLCK